MNRSLLFSDYLPLRYRNCLTLVEWFLMRGVSDRIMHFREARLALFLFNLGVYCLGLVMNGKKCNARANWWTIVPQQLFAQGGK